MESVNQAFEGKCVRAATPIEAGKGSGGRLGGNVNYGHSKKEDGGGRGRCRGRKEGKDEGFVLGGKGEFMSVLALTSEGD